MLQTDRQELFGCDTKQQAQILEGSASGQVSKWVVARGLNVHVGGSCGDLARHLQRERKSYLA